MNNILDELAWRHLELLFRLEKAIREGGYDTVTQIRGRTSIGYLLTKSKDKDNDRTNSKSH
jgi:hypothetical protein